MTTAPAEPVRRLRPAVNQDTAFWYEGAREGELRIQSCAACGRLRHPPCPMCAACGSPAWSWVVASGRGHVYSWVVHHHPPVPGIESPFVVVLVELDEGVRVVGNLLDGPDTAIGVGTPVELVLRADPGDDLVLPQWRIAR